MKEIHGCWGSTIYQNAENWKTDILLYVYERESIDHVKGSKMDQLVNADNCL